MNILIVAFSIILQTSIYTHSITDVNGNTISLSAYQGKKMLLVNIATGSERVSQLAELQQLHQLHHDSLVIIAFPSNSFGQEQRSNSEIKTFCQANYNTGFIIAAKNSVAGSGLQPVYTWLASAAQNGADDISIVNDFQKILLDKYGDVVGVFAPTVSPTSSSIQNAIAAN
jgi:glutathione peroxidase